MQKKPPNVFQKLSRLTVQEALILAEAMVLVVLAAPMVRFIPFKTLGRMASGPVRRPITDPQRRAELVSLIGWAVDASFKRSPLRSLCFECGLTAQIMLRRRGVDSTLYFGARPAEDKGVAAHVWVLDGEANVTGARDATLYKVLAAFPERGAGLYPKEARS